MPQNFWLTLAVEEAVLVAQGVLAVQTTLTPAQKTALESLIAAGQQVAEVF